ncbi:MAG: transcriptional regulator [Nitrospirae bacterium GWB2_47_37]|nr:MAG: transcriptional regulator [Nitrospirae bacterium GWA2_46_11]OGW23663.1 MAG: transcriptional regulator [Nitrospirae bacterium GWB2_47_37]
MALTRDFRETIMERAAKDEKFRRGLLTEAVNEILIGNIETGKAILRDYINATITFPSLARKLKKDSKSLHRMLGPKGNPRLDSIVGILKILQDHEKVKLHAA